jgi:hypothetical protein
VSRFARFVLSLAFCVASLAAAASATPTVAHSNVGAFVGEWANDDAATNSETRIVIGASGGSFLVFGYGRCSEIECDWAAGVGGPLHVPLSDGDDGRLDVHWDFGFKDTFQTITLTAPGRVTVVNFDHYKDDSGRSDRQENMAFHRTSAPQTFYPLTVSVTGAGSVVSNPEGIACPAACGLELAEGSQMTLTASPAPAQRLVRWGGACTGVGSTCVVSVGGPTNVSVTFAPRPARCVVPRVAGKTLAAARTMLVAAHCRAGATRFVRSRLAKGRVVRSTPAAGARLPSGARVSLVASRGP